MPRKIREKSLDTRAAREKLKTSPTPYYRSLGPDLHLGYRKGATARKWVARFRAEGRYRMVELGHADDALGADGITVLDFWQAQAAAQAIVAKKVAEDTRHTVGKAIDDYVDALAGKPSQQVTRQRLAIYVDPAMRKIELGEVTTQMLKAWLRHMAELPARAPTAEGAPQNFRAFGLRDEEHVRRRRASANRVLGMLRAALNHAFRNGKASSDAAWRCVKPFENIDPTQVRYLSVDESRRLVNSTPAGFRPMVQAALLTGCRCMELQRLQVSDLNVDAGTLHIRKSKTGKARHITLTEEGVAFFDGLIAGKKTTEFLLPRMTNQTGASELVARACKHARIEPKIVFHSLRHTWASLAVMAGMPLMVVAKNLGHSDTRMVEKTYGHLTQSYVAETTRKHAPRFGIVAETNVRRIK